jgi:NAD(P)-dependent dehydrogenase (short-subunit alcohol dehydrogenase family)
LPNDHPNKSSTDRERTTFPLGSFGDDLNVAIFGASGGLGRAFVDLLACSAKVAHIAAFSRSQPDFSDPKIHWTSVELEREETIAKAADESSRTAGPYHLLLVATGILHEAGRLEPEKSWRALDAGSLETAFAVNSTGPALVAKHFLPLLARDRKAAFAALSARVGSIEDNDLGGWYAYRASKAALNMMIKTLSIELARRNPSAICVALHPGTVDTALSKPFQSSVPNGKLFSPKLAATNLLGVLDSTTVEDTGRLLAWDGARIRF